MHLPIPVFDIYDTTIPQRIQRIDTIIRKKVSSSWNVWAFVPTHQIMQVDELGYAHI